MEAPGLDGAEYPDTQNGIQFSLLPMHEHEKSVFSTMYFQDTEL